MKRFEHTFFTSKNLTERDVVTKLDGLGAIGFELASVVDHVQDGNSQYQTFYFKRVKQ